MRSPEAARAIPELVRDGVLSPERAAPLLAAARGEIVSVRGELRTLVGIAVALVTAGVGLFLEKHHEAIGPTTIAIVLAAAAAGTLVAVVRRAPAFSWTRSADSDWLVDGLLVLTIALLGADLAWIETQFTPLGPSWPWHLLVVSLVTAALAVRFDSTVGWTLALSTFAAWRGVAVSPRADHVARALFGGELELRANLLLCAAVFAGLGRLAERFDRKRHFEPATTFLAALAAVLAFGSGLADEELWPLWAIALAVLGAGVTWWSFGRRRLALFALGALAMYAGATRFLFELPSSDGIGCFWFAASTVGAIALLVGIHRRFRAGERS